MSETTNYHLPLTDDDQTRFLDWRNSGLPDSAPLPTPARPAKAGIEM